MAFDSFEDFLAMGNHGLYVWLSYGLTFLILGLLAWHSLSAHGKTRRQLAAQRRRAATAQSHGANAQASSAEHEAEQ